MCCYDLGFHYDFSSGNLTFTQVIHESMDRGIVKNLLVMRSDFHERFSSPERIYFTMHNSDEDGKVIIYTNDLDVKDWDNPWKFGKFEIVHDFPGIDNTGINFIDLHEKEKEQENETDSH